MANPGSMIGNRYFPKSETASFLIDGKLLPTKKKKQNMKSHTPRAKKRKNIHVIFYHTKLEICVLPTTCLYGISNL